MLGRQEEIMVLGQPGQYVRFPFTSLALPFWTENELFLNLLSAAFRQIKIEGLASIFTAFNATLSIYSSIDQCNEWL